MRTVAWMLLLSVMAVPARCAESQRKTLAGLDGVYLIVEDAGKAAEKLGLTSEKINTAVELRLRKHGIRLLSNEQWAASTDSPYVYVNVSILASETYPTFVYNVHMNLRQRTMLMRDAKTLCLGITWDCPAVFGMASEGRIRSAIDDAIADGIAQFANDYLAANPPKPSGK